MSNRRHLVFCRVGDDSLHREWLTPASDRTFDLFLEYHGNRENRFAEDCEFYSHHPAGRKLGRIFELVTTGVIDVAKYDAIWLTDDDISTDATTINRLFATFVERGLWLAQPALTEDSVIAFSITETNYRYVLRFTNYVEPMCPIFTADALLKCLPTFANTTTGWGVDFVWPKLLGYPTDRIAIIDSLPVKHTRPVGTGSFYVGITTQDGLEELQKITGDWGVVPFNFVEYGGVSSGLYQLVRGKTRRLWQFIKWKVRLALLPWSARPAA